MNNRTLTICLEDDLEEQLQALCAETGRSRGDIAQDALRGQLQLMRFERLRRQALPSRESCGGLTDEDVVIDELRAALSRKAQMPER